MTFFRRMGGVLALLLLLQAGCRKAGPPEIPEAQPTRPTAHKPAPTASDSAMPPANSLFRAYDAALLAALRPDTSGARRWVEATLAGLTLEEKIAQLFIVDLPPPSRRALVSNRAMEAVRKYSVGGFLVGRIVPPRQVYRQARRLQEAADVPLFFAADYERGAGRFSNAFTELPSNMALGATRDTALAAAAGRLTAIESRAIGVNQLFAPVVDVNNNPANPIINIRSYGEDPQLVGEMAEAFVRGAEQQGLLTTLKHFPGHGNTSTDTHAAMGAVTSTPAELDSVELAPYRRVLGGDGAQPAAVMTAHLWIEALDKEPLPATFSRKALAELLRQEMGFGGLIVTDDVKMGALHNEYALAERTVRPLQAGADVILTPEDLEESIQTVKLAVEEGRLSEESLDRSVRRVLSAKAAAGLHHRRLPDSAVLDKLLETPRGEAVAEAIADHALTLLETAPVLPLRESERILLVQLSNYKGSESIAVAMDAFADLLGEEQDVTARRFDSDRLSESERTEVLNAAEEADVVVLALYLRLTTGRGEAGLFAEQAALAQALLAQGTPVVLVAFGNPYAIAAFPEAEAALVAYDQTLASVRAAASILQGRQPPRGKLPITVGPYAYGAGLHDLENEDAGQR